jgi:hypothetical protein
VLVGNEVQIDAVLKRLAKIALTHADEANRPEAYMGR